MNEMVQTFSGGLGLAGILAFFVLWLGIAAFAAHASSKLVARLLRSNLPDWVSIILSVACWIAAFAAADLAGQLAGVKEAITVRGYVYGVFGFPVISHLNLIVARALGRMLRRQKLHAT